MKKKDDKECRRAGCNHSTLGNSEKESIKTKNAPKKREYTPVELANFKQQIEQFKKAINEKMKDPNLAKKAAHLLSILINGEKAGEADNSQETKVKKPAEVPKKKAA